MKKLFFILGLITLLFACSDDDDNTPQNPIQNLKLPAEETTFLSGQSVTIEGKGFTTESQIWLRASGTKATGDVQAKVTAVNESSITFEVPEGVEGQQSVILKQNGEEYDLGKLTFKITESHKEKLYGYKITNLNNKETKQIVEIDPLTGNEQLIAILDIGDSYFRTPVFFTSTKEIIGLTSKNTLTKINVKNGNSSSILLDQNENVLYDELVIDVNENLYAYKTNSSDENNEIEQIVKIDINNGHEQVVATLNINGSYFRTPTFITSTEEIIGIVVNNLVKVNIKNGHSTTISLDQNKSVFYDELVTDSNENLYIYKTNSSDKNNETEQIVKVNISNGQEQVVATLNINGAYLKNLIFFTPTQEIVGIVTNNLIKMDTNNGNLTSINLDQSTNTSYDGLIIGY